MQFGLKIAFDKNGLNWWPLHNTEAQGTKCYGGGIIQHAIFHTFGLGNKKVDVQKRKKNNVEQLIYTVQHKSLDINNDTYMHVVGFWESRWEWPDSGLVNKKLLLEWNVTGPAGNVPRNLRQSQSPMSTKWMLFDKTGYLPLCLYY